MSPEGTQDGDNYAVHCQAHLAISFAVIPSEAYWENSEWESTGYLPQMCRCISEEWSQWSQILASSHTQKSAREFPADPAVKPLCFHCKECWSGSNGSGILQHWPKNKQTKANIILNGEGWWFFYKVRNKTRMFSLAASVQHCAEDFQPGQSGKKNT